MDVSDVGELAQDAGVKTLILHHLAPYTDSGLARSRIFEQPVQEIYQGDVIVAEEGMIHVLELD